MNGTGLGASMTEGYRRRNLKAELPKQLGTLSNVGKRQGPGTKSRPLLKAPVKYGVLEWYDVLYLFVYIYRREFLPHRVVRAFEIVASLAQKQE